VISNLQNVIVFGSPKVACDIFSSHFKDLFPNSRHYVAHCPTNNHKICKVDVFTSLPPFGEVIGNQIPVLIENVNEELCHSLEYYEKSLL